VPRCVCMCVCVCVIFQLSVFGVRHPPSVFLLFNWTFRCKWFSTGNTICIILCIHIYIYYMRASIVFSKASRSKPKAISIWLRFPSTPIKLKGKKNNRLQTARRLYTHVQNNFVFLCIPRVFVDRELRPCAYTCVSDMTRQWFPGYLHGIV